MAENTHLKKVKADLKEVLDMMEGRDTVEYNCNRTADLERMERLENNIHVGILTFYWCFCR